MITGNEHYEYNRRFKDFEYEKLLADILKNGIRKPNRTGVDTIGVFGRQMRFSLRDSFPLITTKKTFFKGVAHELIWLISGDTNIKYLTDNNIHIWDEWCDKDGNLGPVYGAQWRNFGGTAEKQGVDQLAEAIDKIKNNPNDRRIIVSAWNPVDLPDMALPPCHMFFHFQVDTVNNELNCLMYQRSCDMFLGVPFNIASYALLTKMVAQVCDLKAGDFIHTLGDAHIYVNHIDQVKEQLSRDPYPYPQIKLSSDVEDIDDFCYGDIELVDYKSHPSIKGEVAV